MTDREIVDAALITPVPEPFPTLLALSVGATRWMASQLRDLGYDREFCRLKLGAPIGEAAELVNPDTQRAETAAAYHIRILELILTEVYGPEEN